MYDLPFQICEPLSNNAFSFDQRAAARTDTPQIHVPALIEAQIRADGSIAELQTGTETVFEDHDGDRLINSTGLRNFIKTTHPKSRAPIYIFDNHNHAFYFWHIERNAGTIPNNIELVHIDQHKDTRQPPRDLYPEESRDEKKLFKYTNEILNVGNFIPPAIKTGLISSVINVDSADTLDRIPQALDGARTANAEPKTINQQCFILDLDMDFFAPELDYIDNNKKIKIIRDLLPHAALITIATSPFFMDQQKAISLLRQLFS